jgi:hypothetical protein
MLVLFVLVWTYWTEPSNLSELLFTIPDDGNSPTSVQADGHFSPPMENIHVQSHSDHDR